MITIEVNGKRVEAEKGEMLLAALRRAGIHVPTLCNLSNLMPSGACRLCVVEVEGQRNLVPSCAFPVAEGMKVQTHSRRAVRARKTIIELLLADHPDDCLYCVRNRNCQLQSLAEELGVRERRYSGARHDYKVDTSSPSIVRDPAKCILCGRCVRMCEEVQGVSAIDFVGRGSSTRVGTAFEQGLNVSSCINCGQCIMVCPTGALREQSYIKEVLDAINDPERIAVVQHAPAVSVTLAEELGLRGGTDICGQMTAALRALGFQRVFDTAFTADLTIMEEGSELAHRVATGGVLPMFTSCSPGWIKFVETFYPECLPNLSTCKSPQQMMGAIIKSYFAQREGVDPSKIFVASIMPCTAKKFEAGRPEHGHDGLSDVDAVLTTRELARMIRMRGIDIQSLVPQGADTPFGERSTAGKLFGASGGVMEAAIRTAHFLLTGREMTNLKVQEVRGLDGVKEARVRIGDLELGVAVVSGLGNARRLLEEIRAGRSDLHFIEVMTCPGGCVGGGGQPIGADLEAVAGRMKALYLIDRDEPVRVSHRNEQVQRLYREFLGKPLSDKAHHLLHTHYVKREVIA
ncbi:MAG: NADP-reducing hydrogenase subunit HndC [Planctomycetes bacterium ADurb.Bin126]|nr:MAG: NADP-reducing hydrogenase subunit HndC [Planctomycetes bacterium ADurb.Bin126]HOD82936.1 NADH-dependent [FeFe] hydrogenase, group A6 [Phycisphaerae bacterium]HQL73057.1 NADH-dependent [FeFe] hydrogenase, group A6 [Phycisphaerae bacterium]